MAAEFGADQPADRVLAGLVAGRIEPAQHERPEAVRIAHPDDVLLVEDRQRVGALDHRQHPLQRLDRVARRIVRQERRQQLGVRGRGQARFAALEVREQLAGVDEVAVVADRDRPAVAQPEGRLGVLPDRGAGGGVAAVGNRQRAAQARQSALVENLGDEAELLIEHQLLAVADRYPGRLLAAVLEREDAERGDAGSIRPRDHRAEDAAHG